MSKPIIGVMPLWDDEKNSMWMLPGYFEGISQAGGLYERMNCIYYPTRLGRLHIVKHLSFVYYSD